jgi:hypothetical protein
LSEVVNGGKRWAEITRDTQASQKQPNDEFREGYPKLGSQFGRGSKI